MSYAVVGGKSRSAQEPASCLSNLLLHDTALLGQQPSLRSQEGALFEWFRLYVGHTRLIQ